MLYSYDVPILYYSTYLLINMCNSDFHSISMYARMDIVTQLCVCITIEMINIYIYIIFLYVLLHTIYNLYKLHILILHFILVFLNSIKKVHDKK